MKIACHVIYHKLADGETLSEKVKRKELSEDEFNLLVSIYNCGGKWDPKPYKVMVERQIREMSLQEERAA